MLDETGRASAQSSMGRGTSFLAAGALAVSLAGNGFLMWRTSRVEDRLRTVQSLVSAEIAAVRDTSGKKSAEALQAIEELQATVQQTREEATKAADKANTTARKHAERLVGNLAASSRKQQQELNVQIGQIREAAATVDGKVDAVSGNVIAVKEDLGQTKSAFEQARGELERTIAELRSVRGDLGVQSGLIATNSREIAALRELGDRNYHEFTLVRNGGALKVANVQLQLKKTDRKRNKFSLELVADDKRVEKKDKYINEPLQFYVNRSRVPYELVVNEVRDNVIVGYLATPKMLQARN